MCASVEPGLQLKFRGGVMHARGIRRASFVFTLQLLRANLLYEAMPKSSRRSYLAVIVVQCTRMVDENVTGGTLRSTKARVVGASRHLRRGKSCHLLRTAAAHFCKLAQTPKAVDVTREFTACVNIMRKRGSLGQHSFYDLSLITDIPPGIFENWNVEVS